MQAGSASYRPRLFSYAESLTIPDRAQVPVVLVMWVSVREFLASSDEAKMLEDHVEIKSEAGLVTSEEHPVRRVCYVGMYLKRVEVIGHVEPAYRESQHVLVAHFEVL